MISCRRMLQTLLLLLILCVSKAEWEEPQNVLKTPNSFSDYDPLLLPEHLKKVYENYWQHRDELMLAHGQDGFIVAKPDGSFMWFKSMSATIIECDYPNGLSFALGNEKVVFEILTNQNVEADDALLETLLFHTEVPPEHPHELVRRECASLELMQGIHGKSRRLYVTLPHRSVLGNEWCHPINHMVDHGSPFNSIQDKYWKVLKANGFNEKFHPGYGPVLVSHIESEEFIFVSSTVASKINPAANNLSLIGMDMLQSAKLGMRISVFDCPQITVAYDWIFDPQQCAVTSKDEL